jgi:hypothetical protein
MEEMRDIAISVVISIFLCAILVVIFVICSYIYPYIAPSYQIEDQYEVFKDLLIILLTIAGIAMGTVGYVIHKHLLKFTESTIRKNAEVIGNKMRKNAELSLDWSSTLNFYLTGYTFWNIYDETKQNMYLEAAIFLTEKAYERMSYLDEQEPKNESLICGLMNNLGFYLATRKREEGVPR